MAKLGRPNPLDDLDFCKGVAEALNQGLTRRQMCTLFDVKDVDTITRWSKHPRVRAMRGEMGKARVQQIQRKLDSEIEARLAKADELSLKELIMVRKEFMGEAMRASMDEGDDGTIGAAQQWLSEHPDLADALLESMDAAA